MIEKRNVVLITIDSLRADMLDFSKSSNLPDDLKDIKKKNLTPNLNKLSLKSEIFSNTFSNGVDTGHSVPSMLSSTYPLEYKGIPNLSLYRPYLPIILQSKGYYCYGINSNPWLSRYYGYDKGFYYYYDDIRYGSKEKIIPKLRRWARTPYLHSEKVNDIAQKQIKDIKKPFFLWLYYMDVHMPYRLDGIPLISDIKTKYWMTKAINKKNGILKTNLFNAYQTGIKHVDEAIGNIYQFLKERNLLENTIFIITADHGEKFWEHDKYGHGGLPYDEIIHVPLIIHKSKELNLKKESHIHSDIVSNIQITPTILDLIGIKNIYSFKGESLLKNSRKTDNSQNVIIEDWANTHEDVRIAIRTKKWKYMIDRKKRYLYDLENDPNEKNNRVMQYKDEMIGFEKILRNHINPYLIRKNINKNFSKSDTI